MHSFSFTTDTNRGLLLGPFWRASDRCKNNAKKFPGRPAQTAIFSCNDLDTFSKCTSFSSEHQWKLGSLQLVGKDSCQPAGWETNNTWALHTNKRAYVHFKTQPEIQAKNHFIKSTEITDCSTNYSIKTNITITLTIMQ